MAGILDAKDRILDVLLTHEGRRQLASGQMRVEFVSFSDGSTFYTPDAVSGSADMRSRVYLEATSLPSDQITLEADDAGLLKPLRLEGSQTVIAGQIFSGSALDITTVTGSAFTSLSEQVFSSSLSNFKNLSLIGTVDSVFEEDTFAASQTKLSFVITDSYPIADKNAQTADINHINSLFADHKLSQVDNFQCLTPINKKSRKPLGNYVQLGSRQPITVDEVVERTEQARRTGFTKTISFDPTSLRNNIQIQVFERRNDKLLKLDMLELRKTSNKKSMNTKASQEVVFVGKIYIDDFDTHTFVNIFTLVLE